jgi:hypothetical protein
VADIDDRWFRREPGKPQKVPTARHGRGKRWDVRWRDDAGRQRHKAFERKQEAESFLAQIQADLARGIYTDPAAGKVTVRTYAKSWLAAQTFDHLHARPPSYASAFTSSRNSVAANCGRCARVSCKHGLVAFNRGSRQTTCV